MKTLKFTSAISLKQNWLLQKIPNSDLWRVKKEFIWFLNYQDKKEYVIVARWFTSNFWSIPKPLRIFFNPTKYVSFLLHDALYTKNSFISIWEFKAREPTRKEADYILLEALNVEWAWIIEKFCIYIWVRSFWFLFFKK
jgi:hypothetical protein